jgi:hypothetical protein
MTRTGVSTTDRIIGRLCTLHWPFGQSCPYDIAPNNSTNTTTKTFVKIFIPNPNAKTALNSIRCD